MIGLNSDLILERLSALHPKKIDLSLGRVVRLLERLERPQDRLPPVVHIAGTNGKGSTLAFLDAMLGAAGLSVARYISPHLVSFNERILLKGEPIGEDALTRHLDRCERVNGGDPITFFEITTAAALLAFAESGLDILLLETGLGGRLDATNVVARPLLTLISPVSMDHEAFLGTTIEAIAGEKAGIIKAGVPLVAGPQVDAARDVIARRAAALGAPAWIHGRDWWTERADTGFTLLDGGTRTALPRPALAGAHQIENAGLAAMAARRLGPLAPGEAAIAAGIETARWAGRLQPIEDGPIKALLPPSFELLLDGGHNPAAGRVLADFLVASADGRPVHLVLGMLQNKDFEAFLEPLLEHLASITVVPVEGEQASQDPARIAAWLAGRGHGARIAAGIEAALKSLAAEPQGGPARVLIGGSLYLVGQVLRLNGTAGARRRER